MSEKLLSANTHIVNEAVLDQWLEGFKHESKSEITLQEIEQQDDVIQDQLRRDTSVTEIAQEDMNESLIKDSNTLTQNAGLNQHNLVVQSQSNYSMATSQRIREHALQETNSHAYIIQSKDMKSVVSQVMKSEELSQTELYNLKKFVSDLDTGNQDCQKQDSYSVQKSEIEVVESKKSALNVNSQSNSNYSEIRQSKNSKISSKPNTNLQIIIDQQSISQQDDYLESQEILNEDSDEVEKYEEEIVDSQSSYHDDQDLEPEAVLQLTQSAANELFQQVQKFEQQCPEQVKTEKQPEILLVEEKQETITINQESVQQVKDSQLIQIEDQSPLESRKEPTLVQPSVICDKLESISVSSKITQIQLQEDNFIGDQIEYVQVKSVTAQVEPDNKKKSVIDIPKLDVEKVAQQEITNIDSAGIFCLDINNQNSSDPITSYDNKRNTTKPQNLKILKIKTAKNSRLKFQFNHLRKDTPKNSPKKDQKSRPMSLTFSSDQKVKSFKNSLKQPRVQSFEISKMQTNKLEQVANNSMRNKQFIDNLDKRPYTMQQSKHSRGMKNTQNVTGNTFYSSPTNQKKFGVQELQYSGLSKEEIEVLSIQELFRRMNKNLKGMNRQTIQERWQEIRSMKKDMMNCYQDPQTVQSYQNWGFYKPSDEMILASSQNDQRISYGSYNEGIRLQTSYGATRQRIHQQRTADNQLNRGRKIQEILSYRQNNFDTMSEMDETKLLENFIQEQDRRIDFGQTNLFDKIIQQQSLAVPSGVMMFEEVEMMLNAFKGGRSLSDEFDSDYIRIAQNKIMNTLGFLLQEIGLAKRFDQMVIEEVGYQPSLERLRIITGRTRKVYMARRDLIYIYGTLIQFENEFPQLQHKLGNLKGNINQSLKNMLQSDGQRLKNLVVQLIYSIRNLLNAYKFFNESFVFNGRDYLKYLANEMKMLNGQFAQFQLSFV